MFGNSKRELKFAKLTEKAISRYKGFDVKTKGLSKKDLASGIDRASRAGVTTIIDGLKAELASIVGSRLEDQGEQIADAFRLAKMSVDRMLAVSEVKAGTAHWLNFAFKGIEEPRKKEDVPIWVKETMGEKDSAADLKAVDLDDGTPIWLRGKSQKSLETTKDFLPVWVTEALSGKQASKDSEVWTYAHKGEGGVPSLTSKLKELEALAKTGSIRKLVAAFDEVIGEVLATDFENKAEIIRSVTSELASMIGDERVLDMIANSKSVTRVAAVLRAHT